MEPQPGINDLSEYLNPQEWSVTVTAENEFTLDFTDGENVEYSQFLSGEVGPYAERENQDLRYYRYTLTTEIGEEGPPSPVSNQVYATRYQPVALTMPSGGDTGEEDRNYTERNIYRSDTGEETATWAFIATIPVEQQEYTDEKIDLTLGSLPTAGYYPPPDKLRGLQVSPQGFGVGFYDNKVAISEPYLLHAWPLEYEFTVDYEVVGVGIIDNGIVVATTGRPYLIQGVDPRSMTIRRIELNYGCLSKRSIVSMGYSVIYASQSGLVMVSPNDAQLLTRQIMTEHDWAHYYPHTIHAYEVNERYVGFYHQPDGSIRGGFVVDPREMEQGIIDLGFWTRCAFRDPNERYLYYLQVDDEGNQYVMRWDSPFEDPIAFVWRSKTFILPKPTSMGAF